MHGYDTEVFPRIIQYYCRRFLHCAVLQGIGGAALLTIAMVVALILTLSFLSKLVSVRAKSRLLTDPLLEPADLAQVPLPQELFAAATTALAAEGFSAKGDLPTYGAKTRPR